jgi:hypothetical protein
MASQSSQMLETKPETLQTDFENPAPRDEPCGDEPFEAEMLWAFYHSPYVFVSARATVMPASVAQNRLAHVEHHLKAY